MRERWRILENFIESALIEYVLQIILFNFEGILEMPCEKKIHTPQGKNFAVLMFS